MLYTSLKIAMLFCFAVYAVTNAAETSTLCLPECESSLTCINGRCYNTAGVSEIPLSYDELEELNPFQNRKNMVFGYILLGCSTVMTIIATSKDSSGVMAYRKSSTNFAVLITGIGCLAGSSVCFTTGLIRKRRGEAWMINQRAKGKMFQDLSLQLGWEF